MFRCIKEAVMYKGIGGSSGYGIGKIVIIKNDMPVYENRRRIKKMK